MAVNKILLLPLLSMPLLAPGDAIGPIGPILPDLPDYMKHAVTISTSIMGPYEVKKKYEVTINFKNTFDTSKRVNFTLTTENPTYGIRPCLTINHIVIPRKNTAMRKIEISTAYMTEEGLTYHFLVQDDKDFNTVVNASLTLYPYKQLSVDVNEAVNKKICAKRYTGQLINNFPYEELDEEFDFTNSISTFEEATYYALDISKLKFRYSGDKKPNLLSGKFSFKDTYNSFPNLAIRRSVKLPININMNEKHECYFTLQNQLFVNPNTLDLSTRKLDNYIPSKKFYLPRNRKHQIDKYTFIFTLEGLGETKTNLIYRVGYFFNKNLIGDCNDSDYCVVGGMSND